MRRLILAAVLAAATTAAQAGSTAYFIIPEDDSPNPATTTVDSNGGVSSWMPSNPDNPHDKSGILLRSDGKTCNVMGDLRDGAIMVCH